jgi:hypothetical protein
VSAVAGVLLAVPAAQMILARRAPVFPRRVATRRFDTRRLARVVRRVVPVLRWLERFIRPRWTTPFEATKRVVGGVVMLLGASLLAPVPLSNVPPALTIALIAFAYLEEDGVLLCAALAAALAMLAVAAAVAWETTSATGWVPGLLPRTCPWNEEPCRDRHRLREDQRRRRHGGRQRRHRGDRAGLCAR